MAVVTPDVNDLLASTKTNGTLVPRPVEFHVVAGADWREVIYFAEADADTPDFGGSQWSTACVAVTRNGSVRLTPTVTRGVGSLTLALTGEATEGIGAGQSQSQSLGIWLTLNHTPDGTEVQVLAGHSHVMYLHPGTPA